MHHSEDTAHWNSIIFDLTFKGHEVNWNTIYDLLLYVFHINFCHNMHHLEDTAHKKTQLPWFDL